MLSKEERTNLLASLTNADNTEIIEQIVNDCSDMIAELEKLGTFNEENGNSTFTPTSTNDYQQKYEELQKKFIARFMNNDNSETEIEEQVEGKTEDEENNTTVEDLFKEEK